MYKQGTIIIHDLTGKIVKVFSLVRLDQLIKLSIQELAKGIYMVEVTDGSFKKTIKMIKL